MKLIAGEPSEVNFCAQLIAQNYAWESEWCGLLYLDPTAAIELDAHEQRLNHIEHISKAFDSPLAIAFLGALSQSESDSARSFAAELTAYYVDKDVMDIRTAARVLYRLRRDRVPEVANIAEMNTNYFRLLARAVLADDGELDELTAFCLRHFPFENPDPGSSGLDAA